MRILFFSLAVFFIACTSTKKKEALKPISLSLHITNTPDSTLVIKNGFATDTINISKPTTFYSFNPEASQSFFTIKIGDKKIHYFGKPNSSVNVKINKDRLPFFRGDFKRENNLFQQLNLIQKFYTSNYDSIHLLDTTSFFTFIKKQKSQQIHLLDSAQFKSPIDTTFLALSKKLIDLQYLRKYYNHPYYFYNFSGGDSLDISDDYYQYPMITNFDLNQENLIQFDSYINLIYILLSENSQLENPIDFGTREYHEHLIKNIKTKIKNAKVKEAVLHYALIFEMSFNGLKYFDDSTVALYNEYCKDSNLIALFNHDFKRWEQLQKGAVAQGFQMLDKDSNVVLLQDFKGQNLYVSTWASWCTPCKFHRPYLKGLVDKYAKEITFLYVSVDENKNHYSWVASADTLGKYGQNLRINGGWESAFTHAYKIKSIPRYLMIDKSGKIIDANAPQPYDLSDSLSISTFF